MGFDLDWIHHNGRTNIALFVDEWAPFTTFDKEDHHNWFGLQFGHSQIFSLFNEELNGFKAENRTERRAECKG